MRLTKQEMINNHIYKSLLLIVFGFLTLATTNKEQKDMKDIYKYNIPNAGEITPKGWISQQLSDDLTGGYIGVYNQVNPTVTYNVFTKQNRLSKRRFSLRKEWWSGEHEGYWKDAVIRMAFLTNNKAYIEQTHQWINELLSHIDNDGYIGIYADCQKPGCRFNHVRGNGELWVTSRILMAMLAYYQFTGNTRVLAAAEKAVDLVINQYSQRNYFTRASKGGGVSHGIGFFESLDWLYRITGKKYYLDFAEKLYDDFNQGQFRDDDLKTELLLDKERPFQKHGAHIAEGIFVPQFIANINKRPFYQQAADNAMLKLENHLTPGGAMRCDEWLKGRPGTADEQYEYCGIAEMVGPMNKIFAYNGDFSVADKIETMTFNAGQGARLPVLTALSYLTSDNRLHINHREIARREHYDAAHLAAACCALNGGRLMPYYVEGMWMKNNHDKGLTALLLGPCEINTHINDIPVKVSEITNYPFSDTVNFVVHPEKETAFPLVIRKPFGCSVSNLIVPNGASVKHQPDRIIIDNRWKQNNKVQLTFNFSIDKIQQPASKTVKGRGVYFKRGPLVFAQAFSHRIDTVKEYNESGFYRYKIKPDNLTGWKYRVDTDETFTYKQIEADYNKQPWHQPVVALNGYLYDNNNKKHEVTLVPLGNTIFRRVTFSVQQQN